MANEIIVALISLGGSAIGSIFGIAVNSKLTNFRLQQLEECMKKYNNVIERTYKLEEKTKLQDEKMAVANHRISDIEEMMRR